jgi:hypothetical protein
VIKREKDKNLKERIEKEKMQTEKKRSLFFFLSYFSLWDFIFPSDFNDFLTFFR